MITFNSLDDIINIDDTAVALGNFDGVHLGHQQLIKEMTDRARQRNLKPAVFTFSNHPKDLLPNRPKVKNILYKGEKERLISALGAEYLFSIPFTQQLMIMSPEDYVREIIIDRLRAKEIFCGFNHRFGYRGAGTPELMKKVASEYGVAVNIMEPFTEDGSVVSSSLIRTLIFGGRVDRCRDYMGRYYAVRGEVVVGHRLGRRLGFPTSNLVIDEDTVVPPNGVYVTYCVFEGRRYPSVTNVGVKPTIGSCKKNIETHIFDFDMTLYGKTIEVEFVTKMRDEVKFDSMDELSEQIVRDCREARAFHETL